MPWQGQQSAVTLEHDPWRPVPRRGGHLGLDSGPVDRADIDSRADMMVFTAEACPKPECLMGQPLASLDCWSDEGGFDLCCALSVVGAAGLRALQISTGVCLVRERAVAQPRCRRQVRLQPFLLTLQTGQRLRLYHPSWGQAGPEHRVTG